MSNTVTGKLILKQATQVVSDKFKKREFVIEINEVINGNTYTNYGKFQLTQNKCDILDKFNEGNEVTVSYNIKGNKYEKDGKTQYITNLDAWRIEAAQSNDVVNYNEHMANQQNAPTLAPNQDSLHF